MNNINKILIGNTFPMTLIVRHTEIDLSSMEELKSIISEEGIEIHSFWGHVNTQEIAEGLLGCSLGNESRKALTISENNLPVLDGVEFKEVWVVSPRYIPGFRPAIEVEVEADKIVGWQVLRITFPE